MGALAAIGEKLNGVWSLVEAESQGVEPLMRELGAPGWIVRLLLMGDSPPLGFEVGAEGLMIQVYGLLKQKNIYTWAGPNSHRTPDGGKHKAELLLTLGDGSDPADPTRGTTVATNVYLPKGNCLLSTHSFLPPNKKLLTLQLSRGGAQVLLLRRVFVRKPEKTKK